MTDEAIKKIYDNTINIVLNEIDEESKESISYFYYEYLNEIYKKIDIKNINIEKAIQIFSNLELLKWKNMSAIVKKMELIKDEALDNIRAISSIALNFAKQKVETRNRNEENTCDTLDKEKADKYIQKLNTYLSQVKDYNKQLANYYVSEGIMDLNFASGKTNYTSLRIGRIIR